MEPHPIIEEFVHDYLRLQDFFTKAAELCREQCHARLAQEGIRHIATSRSKRRDRLREKLYQRHEEKPERYQTKQEIIDDIIDLAGVRIALYFPADRKRATELLQDAFDVSDERSFPKAGQPRRGDDMHDYRFPGYSATHLLVSMKPTGAQEIERYASARIEIQIASVFMHAWSEVEHDLVYKPFSGQLSQNEYALLDQVNGLAYTAEVALEHLQRAVTSRITDGRRRFANHYELAAAIYGAVSATSEPKMGPADTLLRYLRELDLDVPPKLEQFLPKLSGSDTRALVDQLVDLIVASDPNSAMPRREVWTRLRAETAGADATGEDRARPPHNVERQFRKHWKTLNAALNRVAVAAAPSRLTAPRRTDVATINQFVPLDRTTVARLLEADQIYTRLLTDTWNGSDAELIDLSEQIERVIEALYCHFPNAAGDGAEIE